MSKVSTNRKSNSDPIEEKAQQKLLEAALVLFAEKGFDGATVKEIADRAEVNVSLVSYHFAGKDGLYRACLERFASERFEVAKRVLQVPKNIDEFKVRLQMMLEEMIEGHLAQPELIKILHRELEQEMPLAEEIFRNSFFKSIVLLESFLKEAQKNGILRNDFLARNMTILLISSVCHYSQKDHILEKFMNCTIKNTEHRKELIRSHLQMFLNGFANQS